MKKAIALGLALAMGTSLLAACGSTASSTADAGTSTNASSETATTETTGDTIRIGGITAVTGDKAEMGESFWRSWELAIEKVNENGGVLGKQVELVLEDSKGDSKEAVELTKKMGDDESIVGVLGPMTSSEAIACAPIFEEYTNGGAFPLRFQQPVRPHERLRFHGGRQDGSRAALPGGARRL